MRHPNPDTLFRLATGDEAVAADVRAHVNSCAACRRTVEETARAWALMETHDPAGRLGDEPLWPGVLAAVEAREVPAKPAALVPAWRFALAEAGRAPLAYAALAALVLGVAGGNLAGRAVLGGPAEARAATYADATQVSSLSGLREGSLAWSYLEADLESIGADLGDANGSTNAAAPRDDAVAAPSDSGAEGGRP